LVTVIGHSELAQSPRGSPHTALIDGGQFSHDSVADFPGKFESAAGLRKIKLRQIARIADIHAVGGVFKGIIKDRDCTPDRRFH